MTIEELYSEYLSQSGVAASASHSDHDDHSDSGYSDFGNHEDWGENIHVDYNSGSGYKENFTINLTANGEIFARVIVQGGLESNWQGGDIKIVDASGEIFFRISRANGKVFDSTGGSIFSGGGTIILYGNGDYEISSDDEDFDDEDFDAEDFDADFAINFLDGAETSVRVIFQGEFESRLQSDDMKIFDSYGEFLFQIDTASRKISDADGEVIFQRDGTIILRDDGEFQTYDGQILSADRNFEDCHEDYYTDEHEDNHRHSDYDDHDDSSSHDDYDDDYSDYEDYDDYDDTYSDWS